MSDEIISTESDAIKVTLDELEGRYKEHFKYITSTEIKTSFFNQTNENRIEMLVAPILNNSNVFSAYLYVNAETKKQSHPVLDNYQQYLFMPIVCKPFEEYFANCEGVDGYSASLFYNKMDSKVWTADQVEQYMGFGVDGDPEVSVIIMLAKDSTENLAHLIYKAHIDLAKLKRNMKFVFGISGSDMKKINNAVYSTHVDYEIFITRKSAQISYESVLDEVSSNIKKVTDDGWDGTVVVGDLDKVIPSITWKQKKQ
ncbi:MAG: hypothetical protein K6F24_04320 [Atopobiaceae bacterium]|nr:hypothetical protein [Atopobiaceae bacterium]